MLNLFSSPLVLLTFSAAPKHKLESVGMDQTKHLCLPAPIFSNDYSKCLRRGMKAERAGSHDSSVHFQPLSTFQITVAQVLYTTNWQQLFNIESGTLSTVQRHMYLFRYCR